MLGACTTARVLEDWPEKLPPQQYFIRAWQADTANQPLQDLEDYLLWVSRFYEGRPGIMGWNSMTEALLQNVGEQRRERMEQQRRELGMKIAAEWAKHNNTRLIDTAMLSLWGSVMIAKPGPEYQMTAMQAIARDVEALLNEELTPEQITEERYEGLEA